MCVFHDGSGKEKSLMLLGGGKTLGSSWIIIKCASRFTVFLRVSKTEFLESNWFLRTIYWGVINVYHLMQSNRQDELTF